MKEVKRYIEKNSVRLFYLAALLTTLLILGGFPYLNVVINLKTSAAFVFLLAIVVLRLKPKVFALFAIAFFLIAAVVSLLRLMEDKVAEILGGAIYFFLALWIMIKIYYYLRFSGKGGKNER